MLYLAVIADVIDSRSSKDMVNISERLREVNEDLKKELLVPFRCFRGDELEAVMDPDANFMRAVRALKYRLRPLRIRVGLGLGQLDVDRAALPDDPFSINGAAFFAARDAIDHIKHEYKEQESIVFRAGRGDFRTWDIMLRLYGSIVGRWNTGQWNYAMRYEVLDSMKDVAAELNKKYQSVQRSLNRADWSLVRDCEDWFAEQMALLKHQFTERSD